MIYNSETHKIRDRVLKYCKGIILDVGCGADKIKSDAIGIDIRSLNGVDIVSNQLDNLTEVIADKMGRCDAVYSSHCLEHFKDDWNALTDWIQMLRVGGYLVLYLPCDTKYDNKSNPEHVQIYTKDSFLKKFRFLFDTGLIELVEAFNDFGEDRYSFCVVAKRAKRGKHGSRILFNDSESEDKEVGDNEASPQSGPTSAAWVLGYRGK